MAMGGPNPGLWGDSVRNALNGGEERGAHEQQTGGEQARLDQEELREFERSGVYGAPPPARDTPPAPQPSRLRGNIARIFRRSG